MKTVLGTIVFENMFSEKISVGIRDCTDWFIFPPAGCTNQVQWIIMGPRLLFSKWWHFDKFIWNKVPYEKIRLDWHKARSKNSLMFLLFLFQNKAYERLQHHYNVLPLFPCSAGCSPIYFTYILTCLYTYILKNLPFYKLTYFHTYKVTYLHS